MPSANDTVRTDRDGDIDTDTDEDGEYDEDDEQCSWENASRLFLDDKFTFFIMPFFLDWLPLLSASSIDIVGRIKFLSL